LWDDQELRLQSEGHGDYYEKQDNLIEGLHCWTSVSGEMLTEWGTRERLPGRVHNDRR